MHRPRPTARLHLPPLCTEPQPTRRVLPARILRASVTVGWARRILISKQARPGSATAEERGVVEHSGGRFAGDASVGRPSGCPGVVSPELGCLSRSGHRWECPCLGTAYSVPTQHSPELVGRRDAFLGLRTCCEPAGSLMIPASSLFAPSGPTPAHIVAAKEAFALDRQSGRIAIPACERTPASSSGGS